MCTKPTKLHFSFKMCPKSRKLKFSEMARGRSGQVRNIPTDFLQSLQTETGRNLVGIGDAEVDEDVLICCILTQILRWIENWQKYARNAENESCQKWSGEGQVKSATSPRTSYEASGPKSGDIWSATDMPVAGKLCNLTAENSFSKLPSICLSRRSIIFWYWFPERLPSTLPMPTR